MLRRLELSAEDHHALIGHCQSKNILFLSTPFEEESADFLDRLGLPAFKVSSGEITNLPFLGYLASKGKPLILSTGMATMPEIDRAIEVLERAGNSAQRILLQCVSEYPADPAQANLRAMATLADAFGCPAGYSDHTPGTETAMAAAALGACVVEKHFTLDRSLPGPDHNASLEPEHLRAMVRGIRVAESAVGDGVKRPLSSETVIAAVARKSLVAAVDIPAGTVLRSEHIVTLRPGTGLPPAMKDQLVGRTTTMAIAAGSLLRGDMIA